MNETDGGNSLKKSKSTEYIRATNTIFPKSPSEGDDNDDEQSEAGSSKAGSVQNAQNDEKEKYK